MGGHGVYITEQVAWHSAADIIRIFPAWPAATDLRFTNLPAYGGFEVSAEQADGRIRNIRITSTVGGPVKLVCPWGQTFRVVAETNGRPIPVTTIKGISSFDPAGGQTYLLKRSE